MVRKPTLRWPMALLLVLMSFPVVGGAAVSNSAGLIYLDENFETGPFINRNWPVQDRTTTITLTQGLNLRSSDTNITAGKTASFSYNQGTRTTERFRYPSYSYRLNSGNLLGVAEQSMPGANLPLRASGQNSWQFHCYPHENRYLRIDVKP